MENLKVDYENKKLFINNKEYQLVFTTCEQLGDDSCYDRGIKLFIVFDKEEQKHYSVSSRYYTYIDEDTGDLIPEYEKWVFKSLD